MVFAHRFTSATLAFIILSATALWCHGAGGDWPQWRGPQRDAVSTETGLLGKWPAEGPALAWKTAEIGGGYAGVSIAEGRIYTMGDGADACYVYALEEAGGKRLWAAKVGKTGGGGGYPGPRCTPAVSGDLVFALGQFGDLICVEAATGTEKWRKNLEQDFAGQMMSGWGYSESPLVDGDNLICTPGGAEGTLVALNKRTGELVWRSKEFTDKAAYSSVVPVAINGTRQYIQLTDESVAGVGADDGKLLWKAPRKGATAVIPTPIFHDDCVYVTSGYGNGCNLFKITASGGAFTAEQVYANKIMGNHHGGVILMGDHLYGYSEGKGWVCQEFKSGKMIWSEKAKLGKGSIGYADGHFYLRLEAGKGTITLIEATPTGYVETGRFDPPDRSDKNSWPPPVIAAGRLYIRDQDTLLSYNIKAK